MTIVAALRFWHLGAKSLWFDEALTAWLARSPSQAFARALWRGGEANMALYYVIMRGWTHLGSSEWRLRSFSVLAGIAAVPIFYALTKRLAGTRAAVIAALLLAVNACHIAYSQEARSYALFFLLAILSSWLFVRGIELDKKGDYAGYAGLSALMIYSHFFGFLLVGAQWISLVAVPRGKVRWRRLLFAGILFVLLAGPALFFVLGGDTGQLAWVPKPSFRDLQRFGYFLVADNGSWRHPLLAVYLVVGAIGAVFLCKRGDQRDPLARWKCTLLLCWFLAPPIAVFLVSFWKPLFVSRFLLFCLAPLLILSATALSEIRRTWLRATLAVALAGASLVPTFWYYRQPKEQWREAIIYIAAHAQPGDSVLLVGNYARVPFAYYRPRVTWPADISVVATAEPPTATNLKGLGTRAWVLMHGGPTDLAAQQLQRDLASPFRQAAEETFFMVTVRLYSRPNSEQNP